MPRRPGAQRQQSVMAPHEARYIALLAEVVAGWGELVDTILAPVARRQLERAARRDAVDDIEAAVARLRSALTSGLDAQREDLEAAIGLVGEGVAEAQLDILAPAVQLPKDAAVQALKLRGSDVVAPDALDGFAARGVDLIVSQAEEYLDSIRQEVAEAFEAGERWEDLSARLQERLGVAQSSADLIAVDQVGKLNAEVTAERHQDLGITHFVWRTLNDERVREEHQELDGQVFEYSDPPDEGLPGQPIRCRCYAEPVLPAELREAA